jgi:hypothetical protein
MGLFGMTLEWRNTRMNWFTPPKPTQTLKPNPAPQPPQPFKPKLRYELFAVADQRPMESSQCDRAITYNGVKVGRIVRKFWGRFAVSAPYDQDVDREIQHWFAQYVVAEDKAHKIHQDAFMAKCARDQEARRLEMRAAIGMDLE